jgi:rare lipoprotein A
MRRVWIGFVVLAAGVAACTVTPKRAPPRPSVATGVTPTPAAAPSVTPSPPPPATPPRGRPADAELLALPDAIPRLEPRALLGNPAFYEVYGQRYTVLNSAHGFIERGVASWYGPDFHGIATSTGEPYDMYSMTAAHKTLPLPAYARVTNLKNGRSIVVRINDRGPFKSNRIIDLSYAAALKLDMIREGTTLVEVQAVDPDGSTAQDGLARAVSLYAQVGAFGVLDNARRLRDRLSNTGIDAVNIQSDTRGATPMHRVRVGPIQSVEAYDALVERLHRVGVSKVVLAPN